MAHPDLPVSFFIVGAQKSGTTTLHQVLQRHPAVHLPAQKETKFFADDRLYSRGIEHYHSSHFAEMPAGSVAGEVDPEYMYFRDVPARIAAYSPQARIIFILRNPIDRAYSHYLMSVRRGFEDLPFGAALEAEDDRLGIPSADYGKWLFHQVHFSYVQRGYYHRQIERFLEFFPRENCHVCVFDDFKADPAAEMARITGFLDLPPVDPGGLEERHNAATMPRSMWLSKLLHSHGPLKRWGKRVFRKDGWIAQSVRRLRRENMKPYSPPPMARDERAGLASLYRDDAAALSDLIGRDVRHWTAPE